MTDVNILSYFCPVSKRFDACAHFKKLTDGQKAVTLILTIFATIGSLPFFGLGGLATFRAVVNKYYSKIDTSSFNKPVKHPHKPTRRKPPRSASDPRGSIQDNPTTIKAHRCAIDDFGIGLSPKRQKKFGYDFDSLEPLDLIKPPKVVPSPVTGPKQTQPSLGNPVGKSAPVSAAPGAEPAPAAKTTPLDKEPADKIRAYAAKIQKELIASHSAKETIQEIDARFKNDFDAAYKKAIVLHNSKFKEKFSKQSLPVLNPDGTSSSTLFQLKTAIYMAQEAFPGLTALAFKDEHQILVARLIQTIMCGYNKTQNSPLPETPLCFTINEIDGARSPEVEYEMPKNSSFLDYLVDNLTENKSKIDPSQHAKHNIQTAVHLFKIDNIDRSNEFAFQKTRLRLGPQTENGKDPLDFLEIVRGAYLEFLSKNAPLIKDIIAANKNSKFVKTLTSFSEGKNDNGSIFSENALNQVLEKESASDPHALLKLNKIVEYSRISAESLDALAKKSGCDAKDIEPLVRIKFLELIMLMNQRGIGSEGYSEVTKVLTAGEEEPKLRPSIATNIAFVFEQNDFQSVEFQTVFPIRINKAENIRGFFNYNLPVASITTRDKIDNIQTQPYSRKISALGNLRLSWQVSDEILDELVGQIDPDVITQQPARKFAEIQADIVKACDSLKKFAEIKDKDFTPEQGAHYHKELDKTSDLLDSFLHTVALLELDKKDDEVASVLSPLRQTVTTMAASLRTFKNQFEKEGLDDELEIIDGLLSQADRLLSRLPTENIVKKGYLNHLRGIFRQSENSSDIAWKVQKYESLIRKLRQAFENSFSPGELKQDLTASWVDAGDPARFVKQLYNILTSVELKNDKDRFNQKYLRQVRDVYNDQFLPKLRHLALFLIEPGKEGKLSPEQLHLFQVCHLLFTNISLEQEFFETIEIFNKMGAEMLGQDVNAKEPAKDEHPFIHRLNALYERINAAPYSAKAPLLDQWGNSARGQWNRNFDPYRQGNPVHVLYQLAIGDRYVKALGMGTPTAEDNHSRLTRNAELLGMLYYYKENGLRHLYVNNQNTVPQKGVKSYFLNGDETNRTDSLLDLTEDKDYTDLEGTYFAISLAKNTAFYAQKNKYRSLDAANHFKKELYNQVFEMDRKVSGCYIPEIIRNVIAKPGNNLANNLIASIHKEIFGNRENLTVEERRLFIELFYDNLVKLILVEMEIDSFNESCKDAIDRGAASNAQLYSNTAIVEGLVDDAQHQQRIESLMLARALYVRKRAPIHERFERFEEGLSFGLKHQDELKNLHKAVFKEIKIKPLGPDEIAPPNNATMVKKPIVIPPKKEQIKPEQPQGYLSALPDLMSIKATFQDKFQGLLGKIKA